MKALKAPAMMIAFAIVLLSLLLNSCCTDCQSGKGIVHVTVLQYAPSSEVHNKPGADVEVLIHSAKSKNGEYEISKVAFSDSLGVVNFKNLPDGTYFVLAIVNQKTYPSRAVVSHGEVAKSVVYVPELRQRRISSGVVSDTTKPRPAGDDPRREDISSIRVAPGSNLPVSAIITPANNPLDTRYITYSSLSQQYYIGAFNYLDFSVDASDAFDKTLHLDCPSMNHNCDSLELNFGTKTKAPTNKP